MAQSKFKVVTASQNGQVYAVRFIPSEGSAETGIELRSREEFQDYVDFLHREGRINDEDYEDLLGLDFKLIWDPDTELDHRLIREFISQFEFPDEFTQRALEWLNYREVRRLSKKNPYFAATLALVLGVVGIQNVGVRSTEDDVIEDVLEWGWRAARNDENNPYCYVEETFYEAVRYAAYHVFDVYQRDHRPSQGEEAT